MCYVIFIRRINSSRWLFFGGWDKEDWEAIPESAEIKDLQKMGFEVVAYQVVVGTEHSLREVKI